MAAATNPLPAATLTATLKLDLPHIEAGVPLSAIAEFAAKSGVPMKDIYAIVIPARTLKHRRAKKQNLTLDESDKLARLVRVFDYAVKVFGEPIRTMHWLSGPKRRFDERSPLEMLNTEIGARSVEEMLGQIDYGMFA
jgi:putative toxin-antitoxin system antitoxin component (TIGR02293 family)